MVLGAHYYGREHGPGELVCCKATFAHAGAIANYKSSESGFVCVFVERKKHELDGKRGEYLRRLGEGNIYDMIELYEKQLKSIKNVKYLYQ